MKPDAVIPNFTATQASGTNARIEETSMLPSRSTTETSENRPGTKLLWPKIVDVQSADFAITLGWLASAGMALWLLVLGHLALLTKPPGTSAWMIPGGAVEAFVAWRVLQRSRTWAVIALLDSMLGISWVLFTRGSGASFTYFGLLALLWRIHGVRGTFAYTKLAGREVPSRDQNAT